MLRAKKYLAIIIFFILVLPAAVFSYTYGPNNWSIKVDPNEANSTIVINGVTYTIKNTNTIGASIFIPLKTPAESNSFLASPIGATVTEVGATPSDCNATGGTITDSGGYRTHTFTTSGTFTPTVSCGAEILVVAGGGGGGAATGGGGGAGGLVYNATYSIAAQANAVTVGAGGAGGPTYGGGDPGGNSVFGSLTAIGGGGSAGNGGSGGGATHCGSYGSGTSGQGNRGGDPGTCGPTYWNAGGGGGAGGVGGSGTSVSGNGGVGLAYTISGSSVYYAGGGGGGADSYRSRAAGTGGLGGGGNGGVANGSGFPGTPNTGGGGGGGGNSPGDRPGGAGGSGVVIIRYPHTPVYTSCKNILDSGASTGNGLYSIDPDGAGSMAAFTTYCDMTGGGWTLVLLNSSYTQHPTPTWANAINSNNITGTQSTNLDGAYDQLVGLGYWNSIGTGLRVEVGGSAASVSHRAYYNYSLNSGNYYSLSLSGEQITTGGTAPGLRVYHATNGYGFTTYDADHDAYVSGNCSVSYTNTPWWYGACWDGNFWGGGTSGGHQNKPFWSGSESDYYNWGAIWVGPAVPSCGTCTYFNGSSCANSDSSTYCSTTSCAGNNSYYISGTASPTGTNYTYYRSYSDATVYCNGSGTCNNYSCTAYTDTLVASCGTCQYASGDASGCTNYANGTACGANSTCDGAGACVETVTPSSSACNATGGTITEVGGYRIHTFTSDGTFTPGNNCDAEVLVVGGGGGGNIGCNGCARGGGGGGAGGLIYTSYSVTGAVSVTVGGGGGTGGAGGNSVFGTLTAYGGGAGGNQGPGNSGGSGGGAGQYCSALSGGSGTSGQGFNGGSLPCRPSTQAPGQDCCYDGGPGAGGGGAGGEGAESVAGLGATYDISGSDVTYATGGLAGTYCGGQTNGPSGAANTGDGGGGAGGCASGATAGSGGSGVVIVRYPLGGGSSTTINPKSCMSIKKGNASAASGVYTIDPDGDSGNTPFSVYCDMTYDGGGWTMMMKATRGTTFNYDASYWTGAQTLNESETNTNDGDAKFRSFNELPVKDLAARWPDIAADRYWIQNGFNDGTAVVLPTFFSNANLKFFGDAKTYSGFTAGSFSSQADIRFYGFNFINNKNYGLDADVRWGFGWNENGEGLYSSPATLSTGAAPGSDDVSGGIGMSSSFGSYSAGDYIACCQDSTGMNRSARVEMYGRDTSDPSWTAASSIPTDYAAYWKFDETSGTSAADSSGNGNNASLVGASFGSGKFGNAASIQSTSAYIAIPTFSSSNITISAWYYYQTANAADWNTLFCRDGGSYHHILINGDSRQIGYYNNGWNSDGTVLNTGNWYHITAVKSGTNEKIYLNGSEIISSNSFDNGSYPFSILGNYSSTSGTQGARGLLDEVRVYNRALSAAEVGQLYSYVPPAATTYTLAYTAGANCSISGTNPQTVESGSDGTAVTVTPDSGYSFTSWSDSSTANPRTDTAVAADISVTATCTALPPATLYCDEDGDGYYSETAAYTCPSGRQQGSVGSDSNDNCYNTTNFTSRPNGADEDCDGQIDEDVIFAMYNYRKADCISGCGTMEQFCASTNCGNQPANYYGWAINPADPPRSCSCICATGDCWVHTYR